MARRTPSPILLLSTVVLLATGCQSGTKSSEKSSTSSQTPQFSKPEMRSIVSGLSDRLREQVVGAATRIGLRTNDPEINRRCLLWKLRVARTVRRLGQQADPRITLLSLWVLTRSQQEFVATGDGKDFFVPYQDIAIDTAKGLTKDVEVVAQQLLTPANYAQARKDVEAYSTAHPFAGASADWTGLDFTAEFSGSGTFASVVAIPLSPFRAIGGVDRTAAAVSEIADVAGRFTTMVSFLPEELRWNTELIMYEFQTAPTTVQLTKDMNTFAASAQSISDSVSELVPMIEGLPDKLQAELTATLDKINEEQAKLQETIKQVDTLVDKVNTEATTANVAKAGETWEGAFGTFNTTLGILMPPPDPNAPPPPPPDENAEETPPFDINDYTAALEQLTKAAGELNTLLSGVEKAAGSDALFGRVDQSVDRTTAEVASIVSRMTWRLAGVVAFAFVLAIVYRFVVVRLIGPAAGSSR